MSEDATDKKLTPKQLKAIEALLTEGDVSQAARAAGVNRTTLYRWLKEDSDFRQALQEAEAAALDTLSRRLVSLSNKAADALETVLEDARSTGHRLRAVDIVLGNLLKIRELATLEARLQELERRFSDETEN